MDLEKFNKVFTAINGELTAEDVDDMDVEELEDELVASEDEVDEGAEDGAEVDEEDDEDEEDAIDDEDTDNVKMKTLAMRAMVWK